ncbi:MAG: hypothetical protein ACSLFE_08280 [Gemmatimonadaceae bacterium]
MMDFAKIKVTNDGVELKWGGERDDGTELVHDLKSHDQPAEDLRQAMTAFRAYVQKLLGITSEEWVSDLVVTGLSINTEKDGRRGLVVTCMKKLADANSPLVLNTPHLREPVDDITDSGPGFFIDGTIELIRAAERAAEAYLQGKRAQGDLFA